MKCPEQEGEDYFSGKESTGRKKNKKRKNLKRKQAGDGNRIRESFASWKCLCYGRSRSYTALGAKSAWISTNYVESAAMQSVA